jgi:hypothetical protein
MFMYGGMACKRKAVVSGPATDSAKRQATTTTAPASRPATTQASPRTFVELVKKNYPECPATQPLDTPLDRHDAARIILRDPIYLDRSQHLWITRADAEAVETVLARSGKETEHFVRERPAYVHWRYEPGVKRQPGRSTAVLVCPIAGGDRVEFIEEGRRVVVAGQRSGYRWEEAFSWDDNIVVGNSTGASVFARTDSAWTENPSPALIDEGTPHAHAQVPVELAGLLAYVPAEGGKAGSKSVARFVEGKWSLLNDPARWPGNFLHLIPLADGSVLQIIVAGDGNVQLAITDFDTTKIDKKQVLQLLDELDSPEHDKRDEAFRQLSTYGSGLWPILEAEMDNQPPTVREIMAKLLKNKTDPTLGEMMLVDTQLKLVGRSLDGGALLYTKGGVAVINTEGDQTLAQNAWISVRAGQPIRLMLGPLWSDLTPSKKRFYAVGGAEWIVSDDVLGPRESVGTFDLAPILKKSEIKYNEFVGIDRRGRWLFREPVGEDGVRSEETLILDPTLPPVTPRLPVWEFAADGGKAGCDDRDWPAYQDKGGNVWTIGESGFHLLDKAKNQFVSDPEALGKIVQATTQATTRATTGAGTRAATTEPTPPLLVLADGTRYYDGKTVLRMVGSEGTIEWPLPAAAQGSMMRPWLVMDHDGRLFLFNEPGRLLRIRPTPGTVEPFKVEATFAHRIPNGEPSRLWVDPAGRIIIAHDGNQLAICFPAGMIPAAIADKMPAEARDDEE